MIITGVDMFIKELYHNVSKRSYIECVPVWDYRTRTSALWWLVVFLFCASFGFGYSQGEDEM